MGNLNVTLVQANQVFDGGTQHAVAHTLTDMRKGRRCNPIVKLLQAGAVTGSASTSTGAWGIKVRVPCDYYAVRLHFFNHHANTPNWQFVVASTETAATTSSTTTSQPVVGGSTYSSLDSTTVGYGWRSGAFAGTALGVATAGTTYAPTILSSDVIPLRSVPRADGGTGRLLMIRASSPNAAAQAYSFDGMSALMNTPTAANRGWVNQTWFSGTGAAVTTPSGFSIGTLDTSTLPVAVELFSHAKGATVITIGDSITANDALVADLWSSWGLRAVADSSTDLNPIGYINVGMSSQNSATFYAEGLAELNLFKPSVAIYPVWTPNDYSTPANADVLRANILAGVARTSQFLDAAEVTRTAVILWTGIPHSSKLTTAALDAVRTGLNTLLKTYPHIVVADFDAIISDGATPAGFVTAYSFGDGIHPNEAGVEAMSVPAAAAIMRCVI